MTKLKWHVWYFNQLSTTDLYEILKLRVDVFIVEQQCPYPELDDKDQHPETRHVCGYDQTGELIAYARILPAGLRFDEINIGRFVIHRKHRNSGLGKELLFHTIEAIEYHWPAQNIKISAQHHLQSFYSQQGFVTLSDMYLEDGIPHINMLRAGKQ